MKGVPAARPWKFGREKGVQRLEGERNRGGGAGEMRETISDVCYALRSPVFLPLFFFFF